MRAAITGGAAEQEQAAVGLFPDGSKDSDGAELRSAVGSGNPRRTISSPRIAGVGIVRAPRLNWPMRWKCRNDGQGRRGSPFPGAFWEESGVYTTTTAKRRAGRPASDPAKIVRSGCHGHVGRSHG